MKEKKTNSKCLISCIPEEFPTISSFLKLFSGHTYPFWNTKHKSEQMILLCEFQKKTADF